MILFLDGVWHIFTVVQVQYLLCTKITAISPDASHLLEIFQHFSIGRYSIYVLRLLVSLLRKEAPSLYPRSGPCSLDWGYGGKLVTLSRLLVVK
jgi:hypothetical protein